MKVRRRRALWLWPALACLLWLGCKRNGPAEDGPPTGPSRQDDAREAPEDTAPPEEPRAGAWPAELPKDYRSCEGDEECAVGPSLAGLDHPPRPGERCEGTCYVGVRRDALEAWKSVVAERAGQVPCDKEFEPCPPAEAFRAACSLGRCKVDYAGGQEPEGE